MMARDKLSNEDKIRRLLDHSTQTLCAEGVVVNAIVAKYLGKNCRWPRRRNVNFKLFN